MSPLPPGPMRHPPSTDQCHWLSSYQGKREARGWACPEGQGGQPHWTEHLPPAPASLQKAVAVRAPSGPRAQVQLGLEAMPACHRQTEAPSQQWRVADGTWPFLTLGRGQRGRKEASTGGPRWSHSVPSCTADCSPSSCHHHSWGGCAPPGPGPRSLATSSHLQGPVPCFICLPLRGPTAALSPPERTHMWRRPVMPRDTYRPMQWARASTSALASSPGSGEACGPAALTSHHPGHLTVPPGPSPPHGAVVHCSTPAGLSSPCRSATFVQFQGHFCLVFPLVTPGKSPFLLEPPLCPTLLHLVPPPLPGLCAGPAPSTLTWLPGRTHHLSVTCVICVPVHVFSSYPP